MPTLTWLSACSDLVEWAYSDLFKYHPMVFCSTHNWRWFFWLVFECHSSTAALVRDKMHSARSKHLWDMVGLKLKVVSTECLHAFSSTSLHMKFSVPNVGSRQYALISLVCIGLSSLCIEHENLMFATTSNKPLFWGWFVVEVYTETTAWDMVLNVV